jgi:hypothetical protein
MIFHPEKLSALLMKAPTKKAFHKLIWPGNCAFHKKHIHILNQVIVSWTSQGY